MATTGYTRAVLSVLEIEHKYFQFMLRLRLNLNKLGIAYFPTILLAREKGKMADTPSRIVTRRRDLSTASSDSHVKTMTSEQLFGQGREIWIDHDGCRYRLRITKRNKLILQK